MEEPMHTDSPEIPAPKPATPLTLQQAILWNGVIIGACVIIAAIILSPFSFGGKQATSADQQAGAAQAVNVKDVKTAGEPFVGDPNAPVKIAYWSDYQCPFCKKFETGEFQDILKNYVQSGKAVVYFKDFSFLGDDSTTAALYARSVWKLYPDMYFAWREAMYNAQDQENAGFGNEESIVTLTSTVPGINAIKVKADVAANKAAYQKLIDADKDEGSKFGVTGTPSILTGTKLISGAYPYSEYQTDIDAQLK